jgi:signal transduction histidine kinase
MWGWSASGRRNRTVLGIGPLGRRLAVTFIGVALAAIVVNTLVSAQTVDRGAAVVTARQERNLATAVAKASALAYEGHGWRLSDFMLVLDLADRAGAGLRLVDAFGHVVSQSPEYPALPKAGARTMPVRSGQRTVGMVTIRFGSHGLGGLNRSLAQQRWHSLLISAAIAAAIALVVSIAVAQAIGGPLEILIDAVRTRGAGGRTVRIAKIRGVGVVREVLESFNHATDALDEQERLHRDLVAKLAHELRTPVAVLQASQEAMLDGITRPCPESLESQRDETLRLGKMIDDLQRLAAAESAVMRLKPARHDLAAICGEAAASVRGQFAAARVSLEQRLQPCVVRCDADRIREVVLNLLTNALKFTPGGGEVALESSPCAGRHGMICVTDSGIGIPEEELPHVTERFYRGLASPGIAAGSGIGLAIVAELVRAHGGQVHIASHSGRGTEVVVTLPF